MDAAPAGTGGPRSYWPHTSGIDEFGWRDVDWACYLSGTHPPAAEDDEDATATKGLLTAPEGVDLYVLARSFAVGAVAPYTITVATLVSAVVLLFVGAIADQMRCGPYRRPQVVPWHNGAPCPYAKLHFS